MKSDDAQVTTGLPRRDLILLPLVSFLTVLILSLCAEVGARLAWPEQKDDQCLVDEPGKGLRGRPNCVSWTKTAEGPWVENRYNDCGLRSPEPCHDRSHNPTLVAVGSSIASGYLVRYEESWTSRAAARLTKRCTRPVTIQNYAGLMNLDEAALRAPEAATANAQAAIMFINPGDLYDTPIGEADPKNASAQPAPGATAAPAQKFDLGTLRYMSRAVAITKYFLYKHGDNFVDLYLRNEDRADYLRPPFTPAWKSRLAKFDHDLGAIIDQFSARNTPLLIIYVPQVAQAFLLSGSPRPGVDPHAIIAAVADIARRRGAHFVDASPRFSATPAIFDNYYIADGHENANGHALLSEAVEDGLLAGVNPLLSNCRAPQS